MIEFENFQIVYDGTDPVNVVLRQHRINQSKGTKNYGKKHTVTIGYYPNIRGALLRLLDDKLAGLLVDDEPEIIEKLHDTMLKLEQMIRSINK